MNEVDIYTTSSPAVISKNECPLTRWETNQLRLPKLSKLAARFLSTPPSSIESERLFSVGGQIYTPRRNRLASETGKKLMFLHFNLKWLKGNSNIWFHFTFNVSIFVVITSVRINIKNLNIKFLYLSLVKT